jgi:hypothetical protein
MATLSVSSDSWCVSSTCVSAWGVGVGGVRVRARRACLEARLDDRALHQLQRLRRLARSRIAQGRQQVEALHIASALGPAVRSTDASPAEAQPRGQGALRRVWPPAERRSTGV